MEKRTEHTESPHKELSYSLKDFLPLIVIFLLIIAFTVARRLVHGWYPMMAMIDFMGAFFVVFGTFKIINLKGFAQAYQEYDLLAKESIWYAYAYPFIEVGLGIAYFTLWQPIIVNALTFVLMMVGAAGVYNELRQGKNIVCGCLGAVFKIPMTWVTLTEDLIMAAMALYMLIVIRRM